MGPERAQGAYVSIKATSVMDDVNVMAAPLQGRLTKPLGSTITGILMDLELKK